MTLLSRLSLRHQILSIGLLGAAGVAALASVYVIGDGEIQKQKLIAGDATRLERSINAADKGLLEARRAEKDFYLRSEEKYATRHGAVINTVKGSLAEAVGQISPNGDNAGLQAEMSKLNDGLATYLKHFNA